VSAVQNYRDSGIGRQEGAKQSQKTVLGVVWLVAFGFGAAADEPKTEEVKKKALDKALETFTGT
jgi:hypothetical protein